MRYPLGSRKAVSACILKIPHSWFGRLGKCWMNDVYDVLPVAEGFENVEEGVIARLRIGKALEPW